MLTFPYHSGVSVKYAQSYDLYLPDNANSSTPLFAFVHGGYWVEDDRNDASGEVSFRIKQLYESVFGADESQRTAASPLHYVGNQSPNMVILSGSNDFPGFTSDAKLFYQAVLNTNNPDIELHILENRGHFEMVDTQFNQSELLSLIQSKIMCD